jgi:hypothetical protein
MRNVKKEKFAFKPLSKVWLSMRPLSQELQQLLKTVFLLSLVPSFNQIGQETWKL